jgi:hypothetical protein
LPYFSFLFASGLRLCPSLPSLSLSFSSPRINSLTVILCPPSCRGLVVVVASVVVSICWFSHSPGPCSAPSSAAHHHRLSRWSRVRFDLNIAPVDDSRVSLGLFVHMCVLL